MWAGDTAEAKALGLGLAAPRLEKVVSRLDLNLRQAKWDRVALVVPADPKLRSHQIDQKKPKLKFCREAAEWFLFYLSARLIYWWLLICRFTYHMVVLDLRGGQSGLNRGGGGLEDHDFRGQEDGRITKEDNNREGLARRKNIAHQNRTIAIANDFRVDGAKSPKIPQKERVWAQKSQPEIANR